MDSLVECCPDRQEFPGGLPLLPHLAMHPMELAPMNMNLVLISKSVFSAKTIRFSAPTDSHPVRDFAEIAALRGTVTFIEVDFQSECGAAISLAKATDHQQTGKVLMPELRRYVLLQLSCGNAS